ncbi:MAG: hypothetical protein O9289_17425 [Rhodobacteraceae bacterium]|nr:hypothetical protein [Paracoccaceae bacterium]MCZ8084982.1 hypothetical protein [Paracoccaceae bacterium]
MGELRAIIATAQTELAELEVAERVLERLADGGGGSPLPMQDVVVPAPRVSKEPTVAEAAIYGLRTRGPMNSADLLSYLHVTWRDDLAQTTLTSTLSRTKKEGRLVYEDGMWSVPATIDRKPDSSTDTDLDDLLGESKSTTGETLGGDAPVADVFR